MNNNQSILNDYAQKTAERRKQAAYFLSQSLIKTTGPVRRLMFRLLGRVWEGGAARSAARPELEKLRRQLVDKTAAQLFKMRRRGIQEVNAERRRYLKRLPKITAGLLPTTLPALQFLESRLRAIEREMTRQGIIYEAPTIPSEN